MSIVLYVICDSCVQNGPPGSFKALQHIVGIWLSNTHAISLIGPTRGSRNKFTRRTAIQTPCRLYLNLKLWSLQTYSHRSDIDIRLVQIVF